MSKNPEISKVDPVVRDASAAGQTQYSVFVQELYYLAILNIGAGKDKAKLLKNDIALSIGPSAANRSNTSPEYYFRLPPKVHEMTEPFATNITMTQDGGKYVESQGSPSKEIRLSGTTGLRPHRNDSQTLKVFGIDTGLSGPVAQAITLGGLGASPNVAGPFQGAVNVFQKKSPWAKDEALGHDDIIFLRNLFRLYAWHKENAPSAASVVMLWRNIKDGDYWLVEPLEFKLSQSSSSPLTYDYSITLKTLTQWNYKVKLSQDPQQLLKDARTFYARVEQSTAAIKNSFLFIASKIDRFSRIPFNISSFILSPMVAVIEGGSAVRRSEKRFDNVFRAGLIQLRDNLEIYTAAAVKLLPLQDPLIRALRRAKKETDNLLADPEMQPDGTAKQAAETKKAIVDAYQPTAGQGGTEGFLGNQSLGQGVSQATVAPGDSIKSIAARLLGDRSKYQILIVLNGLKAPYISPTGGKGVLKPGDTILLPSTSPAGTDFGVISSTKKSTNETGTPTDQNSGGSIEQQYGRDLRLVTGTDGKLLLSINQNGDISTVMGIPNIVQAVKLKFTVERGELPAHPTFGALHPMGSKATSASLAGFRIDVEQTLLSDPRIVDLKNLKFVTNGDALSATVNIVLANSSASAKLTLPLRKSGV